MSYFLAALVVGFVILFHELGHFIAAKRVGVPIAIFSIGFGPRLTAWKWGETEYRLSLIPLGGYVLPAVADEKEFFQLSVKKRILMTVGGPLASFILPIICFSIIYSSQPGLSFIELLYLPLLQSTTIIYEIIIFLPTVFSQSDQLSGIVGIITQGGSIIGNNLMNTLQFMALISLNLTVLNLLPLPVLDGGKILLYLLEKIHPASLRLHLPLAVCGWVLILGLMLYVTVGDLRNLLLSAV